MWKYNWLEVWNFIPRLLAAAVSAAVSAARINMRGPRLPASMVFCLYHIQTVKALTSPKPSVELVVAAIGPAPPCNMVEEKFNARLPVIAPATPELGAP